MAYKVKNVYQEAHIMDLNLMNIGEYKRVRISAGEVVFTLLPLVAIGIYALAAYLPEMGFVAQCVNLGATGDICEIAMK